MNKIYFPIVMSFVPVLMAGLFFLIAFKTLFQRRPILFSSRWLFGFMCMAFLPMLISSISLGVSSKHTSLITWINPVMFPVLLIFFWFQMKGYMVIAVSDTYFREALLSSAATLGYSIEETLSRLKIKETGDEIHVSIQGWIGSAQVKAVEKKSDDAVVRIAKGMDHYFKTTPGKMNYLISYFYLVIGGFMVACAAGLILMMFKK